MCYKFVNSCLGIFRKGGFFVGAGRDPPPAPPPPRPPEPPAPPTEPPPTPATEPTATPTEPTPTPAEATPTPTPEPTTEARGDARTVGVPGHFSWVSISPTSFGDQAWGELQPNQVAFWGQLPTGGSTFFACAGPASGKETAAVTGCVSLLAGYRPTAPNGQP